MKTEHILFGLMGVFFAGLLVFLFVVYKPTVPLVSSQLSNNNLSQAVSSDTDSLNELKSRIKWLEDSLKAQSAALTDLKQLTSTPSANTKTEALTTTSTTTTTDKSVMASAYTRGSTFTTTSTSYTPMGMYVNINCPKNCLLWINFYSSSKNIGAPSSAQGNTNTFGVFIDNTDQGIYSQASYPVDSLSVPVSINAAIPAASGVHTVEVRAKTTSGKLQSDSSGLQVLAVER